MNKINHEIANEIIRKLFSHHDNRPNRLGRMLGLKIIDIYNMSVETYEADFNKQLSRAEIFIAHSALDRRKMSISDFIRCFSSIEPILNGEGPERYKAYFYANEILGDGPLDMASAKYIVAKKAAEQHYAWTTE
ncbi:hypothetical protein D3C87_691980 [compost metagenome]